MIRVIATEPRLCSVVGTADPVVQLRFSPFIYKYSYGDCVLLTNTFTRFFCAMDISNAEKLIPGELVNEEWLHSLTPEELKIFIDNRIFVEAEVDEYQTYLDVYDLLDGVLSTRKKIDRYNILTTNGCNARCYYCFEEGYYPKIEHMSLVTAEKVVKYILDTYDPQKKIYLRWFGGEPLVNSKVIDYISQRLVESQVDFFSTMSTNGLLCTETVVEKAVSNWNMSKIRITLDGWGAEHNKRKQFKSSADGFSIILKNIETIVKAGIIMIIRLSVDKDNHSSLMRLCDYFIEKYSGYDNFKMYAHCLHQDVSSQSRLSNPEIFTQVMNSCDAITNKILSSGMYDCERLQPNGFRMYLCAAQDPTKISITPSGGICRCECLSNDEVTWGTVDGKVHDMKKFDYWHNNINECRDKCKKCFMLPLCTPFSRCPLSYISCQDRFENTLKKYMVESYNRYSKRESPIVQIDCLPLGIDFAD